MEKLASQTALPRQRTRARCFRRVHGPGCALDDEERDRRMAVEISGVTQGPPGLRTPAFFSKDRRRVETDEQYVDLIRTRMLRLVQKWKRTSPDSTLVRYEDLPGQCPNLGKAVAAGHPALSTTPCATKVATTVQVRGRHP